jgi:hypothetical protein
MKHFLSILINANNLTLNFFLREILVVAWKWFSYHFLDEVACHIDVKMRMLLQACVKWGGFQKPYKKCFLLVNKNNWLEIDYCWWSIIVIGSMFNGNSMYIWSNLSCLWVREAQTSILPLVDVANNDNVFIFGELLEVI